MTQTFKSLRQVALVASLLLLPGLTLAQTSAATAGGGPPSMGARLGGWSYGILGALEFGTGDAGPKVSGELMYGIVDLAPNLRLDIGARAAFGYHGDFWYISAVPDAKLVYGINDQFSVYGDFGIGPALLRVSVPTVTIPGVGTFGGGSDTSVKFDIEFGGGVKYALNPGMNLLGEIRVAIIDGNGFVAVPTIGIEWH